jgi:hypothetical protein
MTDAAPVLPESTVRDIFNEAIDLLPQRDRHVTGIWDAIHVAGLKITGDDTP